MTPVWPEQVSGDAIERACCAARMGVDTAIILGSARLRRLVLENLTTLARDGEFDTRYGVPAWRFRSGGTLLLAANATEARLTHQRRGALEAQEVIYPKAGRED